MLVNVPVIDSPKQSDESSFEPKGRSKLQVPVEPDSSFLTMAASFVPPGNTDTARETTGGAEDLAGKITDPKSELGRQSLSVRS
jgi:hypothetical protein